MRVYKVVTPYSQPVRGISRGITVAYVKAKSSDEALLQLKATREFDDAIETELTSEPADDMILDWDAAKITLD